MEEAVVWGNDTANVTGTAMSLDNCTFPWGVTQVTTDIPEQGHSSAAAAAVVNATNGVVEEDGLAYRAIKSSLHLFLAIVIIATNALTVTAWWKFQKLRSVTNNFVVSLCLADLIVAPASLFTQLAPYFSSENQIMSVKTKLFCSLLPATISQGMSLFTLLHIAIDRYIAVADHTSYKRAMTTRVARFMIVGTWLYWGTVCTILISFSANDPAALERVRQSGRTLDVISPAVRAGTISAHVYTSILLTSGFYARIFWALEKQRKTMQASGAVASPSQERSKKITQMMALVLVAVIVCWAPFVIVDAVIAALETTPPRWLTYARDVALFIMRMNSCINPFLYAWKSPAFRRAFARLLAFPKSRKVGDIPTDIALKGRPSPY